MIRDNERPETPAVGLDDEVCDAALNRRQLFRRGALLAGGVAAASAAGALAAPGAADAADGDAVTAGTTTTSTSQTTLQISAGATPTLGLRNDNGPSLFLQPLASDFAGELDLGEFANTELGPLLGVDTEIGHSTTYLATGVDLDDLPTPYALPSPVRLLDTRNAAGRTKILRTSTNALDSSGRVRAGAWLDVSVEVATSDFRVDAAYTNVTVTGSTQSGVVVIYPPGDRPSTSTLNYVAGQTLANAAFVATGIVLGRYAVRLYTSQLAHLVLDLTGVTIRGNSAVPALAGQSRGAARLRSTLTGRLKATLAR